MVMEVAIVCTNCSSCICCHKLTYLSPPSSPALTGRCIVLCHHSLSINGLSFKKDSRDHKSFNEFWIGVPKKKKERKERNKIGNHYIDFVVLGITHAK